MYSIFYTLGETCDAKKSSSMYWGDKGGIPQPSIHNQNLNKTKVLHFLPDIIGMFQLYMAHLKKKNYF